MLKFEEVISYKEQGFQEERQSVIDRPREHIGNIQKIVTERIREIIQQAQEEPAASAESVRKTIREIIPQKDILTDAAIGKLDLKNAKSRAIVKKAVKVRAKRLINSIGIGRLQLETILSMDNLWSNYVNSMTDAIFAAIGETPRGMDPLDTYRKKSGDLFELEKQSSRRGLADKLISLTPKQIVISPK
jgi:preprotein translocase subunit SecA